MNRARFSHCLRLGLKPLALLKRVKQINVKELPDNPTLPALQKYVAEQGIERGFGAQSARDVCLVLGEEIGELFKAIRKSEGLKIDKNSTFGSVSHELADILVNVLAIANLYAVDLEKAFREKEEINKDRTWESA